MTGTDGRWCIVMAPPDARPRLLWESETLRGLGRARLFAASKRTLVAATCDTVRDPCWPRAVTLAEASPVWSTGPLALLATLDILRMAPDASVVLLGPEHPPADTLHFMSLFRRDAQWVEEHPDQLVVVAQLHEGARAWSAAMSDGYVPPTLEEMAERSFTTLGVVYTVATLRRLLEVFAPAWWETASEATRSGGSVARCCSDLEPFSLVDDVLAHAAAQVRVRPVPPALVEHAPEWRLPWLSSGTPLRARPQASASGAPCQWPVRP